MWVHFCKRAFATVPCYFRTSSLLTHTLRIRVGTIYKLLDDPQMIT